MNGFSGDVRVAAEVRYLIERYDVRTIVETGTFRGDTTAALAEMVRGRGAFVHSIERDVERWADASVRLDDGPIGLHCGRSETVLPRILADADGPVLFYLDAHWPDSPVLAELAAIAEHAPDPILVIHDVANPDHGDYAFDTYGEFSLTWPTLREAVEACYTHGCRHWHNDAASGKRVGVLYVVPDGTETDVSTNDTNCTKTETKGTTR